jgi:hypothetical protein
MTTGGAIRMLRIGLRLTGPACVARREPAEASFVEFRLDDAGEEVACLETTAAELGLPVTLADARARQASEEGYQLPDYVRSALASLVSPEPRPLWLALVEPYGYLAVVPWERLLAPLGVPVLRWPYTDVSPARSPDALDLVLCFSAPLDKPEFPPAAVIARSVEQIPADLVRHTRVHVFADASVYPLLCAYRDRYADVATVTVYDPAAASADVATQPRENRWLSWMRRGLAGCSADVVHFVGDGYLGAEHGCLLLSPSAAGEGDARQAVPVGASELVDFLDAVGGWSVAFSSAPGNPSIAGLRLLQEQLARLRPGPVLFHDLARPAGRQVLAEAYRFLFGLSDAPPPASDALALSWHPTWGARGQASPAAAARVAEVTLAGHLRETFESPENTPAWIAASQRALERAASRLRFEPRSPAEAASQQGARRALDFTASVIARHAGAARRGSSEGAR